MMRKGRRGPVLASEPTGFAASLAARAAAGLPDNPDLNKLTPAQNILFGLKLKRSSRSERMR